MLVLTRRVGESVVMGDDIVVQVVGVKGDKVRLGITAPPAITVDREEIHQRRSAFSRATELATVGPCTD